MEKKILVETSARHVHVSDADLKTLFGPNAQLTPKKMLSQPGQFAAEEKVTIVGPKKSIPNVSILGPSRKKTQVEVSATDARTLGFEIVIRESGDIEKTPGCTLVGPYGQVEIPEGVIVAKRHIHLNLEEAKAFGLQDKQVVMVKVNTPDRSLIFGDVVVRVRSDFAAAMHIDTDESNAGCVGMSTWGEIIE
ncbi:MAG TPA: phosphate propanoyltransferase [Bacilli bacterium]|nr:MAG: Phosphate propanoyltransferase [Tenericutes bacterium ADurb.BinA124]HNZ50589.1 phosphate propanoyltransferase [Bacilli bacterium]HOH18066.1 phosphate propanoyltransferase [Bacilli bacterium]HPN61609.1 phosphate propanoyltransferase [Bacilli bacterium]HPX84538.1 phosphate propanoyltransferase [Bacilli bacterium]